MIMIYKINDIISYNSEDSTLCHLPTNECIKLSISSGRLFEHLLDSNGEVVSREYLMAEVWDKYGLSGTNSNLNQYISMLRRILADYGCDNLIITLPKIGLRLNTEVPVLRDQALTTAVNEGARGGVIPEERPLTVMAEPRRKPSSLHLRYRILATIIIACVFLATWLYIRDHGAVTPLEPVYSILAGGCELVLLKNMDETDRNLMNKQIKIILRENKLPCDSNRRLYFDNMTSYSTQNYGRTLLSYCHLGNDREVISCDNIYYINWRVE
ncbi:DNA-binding transcriptional activator CadC [Serratia ficaria]|nr:DNA-binding transcriptional activator CadC [Serratia ficaria]CAI2526401.1 DNA-binding transcriptional activator CadC [Serratia ficaria]VVA49789.1 DNA-binding transcriptional activator CadC [Serratia ficaria]